MEALDIEALLVTVGTPKFDGKTRKQRLPPIVLDPHTPPLDASFDEAVGPPRNANDRKTRAYLRENPIVWDIFVRWAKDRIAHREHFSVRGFAEAMRWAHLFNKQISPIAISNTATPHISRYLRVFIPQVADFIDYAAEIERQASADA
jgi:hypothetical protein